LSKYSNGPIDDVFLLTHSLKEDIDNKHIEILKTHILHSKDIDLRDGMLQW